MMEVLIEGNRQGLLDVFLTDLVTKSMAPLSAKYDVPKFSLYMGVLPYFSFDGSLFYTIWGAGVASRHMAGEFLTKEPLFLVYC
jgi:hypothetical protein